MESKNPYEVAWNIQNKLIEIDQKLKDLKVEKEHLEALYENAINAGQDKPTIRGYNLIVETKTTEKRTLNINALKAERPEIFFELGKYHAEFVARYIPKKSRDKMLEAPELIGLYDLKLGDLDTACGGKKNATKYCDVEIVPKVTKRISRIENQIIEV